MTFFDYLALVRRRWIGCLIITALITISTIGLVQWRNGASFETTVFLTTGDTLYLPGTSPAANPSTIFDNVQADDQFGDTIQGWFKNPVFTGAINDTAGFITDISATKQTRQNVIITYTTSSRDAGEKLSKIIGAALSAKINDYDQATNHKFNIAVFDADTEKTSSSLLLFAAIALLCGFIVSVVLAHGYEFVLGKISSVQQAAEILQTGPVEKFANLETARNQQHFLTAYLRKTPEKDIQFIVTGVTVAEFTQGLGKELDGKTVHTLIFPKEGEKILAHARHIIVCETGKTPAGDLKKIKMLLSESSPSDLVIIEA